MLRQSSELVGYGVHATDGPIGSVIDFLLDDTTWELRWAVVDTGEWIAGREVLLPPSALGEPDYALQQFPVALTREQVENSPDISRDRPVSRQREAEIYDYYGWVPYWYPAIDPVVGAPPYPGPAPGAAPSEGEPGEPRPSPGEFGRNREGDPHLRSIVEITGYYVRAGDGDIGHVEDFLIDTASWSIRYFIVDTKNWWPGRMVLVSTRWISGVSFQDESVDVDLTREQVKASPEYKPSEVVERDYEERLHEHYGRTPYWT